MNYRWTTAVLITGLLVSQSACAGGRKISRTELPPTVEKTFKDQSEGAKVERLSEELENGQIYYKAKMRVEGHHKDVVINSAGDVERVGEQVAVNDLPPAVKAGIKAKKGFLGRITRVESITKRDKLAAYEANVQKPIFFWAFGPSVLMTNWKVQVDPHGKPMDHKE